jgi:hypothetical protein
MINFGYHFARLEGEIARELYRASLPMIVRRALQPPRELPLDVFSYSGEQSLPEQIASIRSFLQHAGRPQRFAVISDGTHRPRSIELLKQIDPVVEVRDSPPPPQSEFPDKIRSYLTSHATGKQLALIMSLPTDRPTLYADSDVLFFPGAHDLSRLIEAHSAPALYLADCQFVGDERLLRDPGERNDPVNTGFLLFFQKLDWSLGLERFLTSNGAPNFFTNQTIAHLCMHANGALPLDPQKYVLRLDDQFVYRDRYANRSLAMRHYVNPVRHKFWTNFARTIQL